MTGRTHGLAKLMLGRSTRAAASAARCATGRPASPPTCGSAIAAIASAATGGAYFARAVFLARRRRTRPARRFAGRPRRASIASPARAAARRSSPRPRTAPERLAIVTRHPRRPGRACAPDAHLGQPEARLGQPWTTACPGSIWACLRARPRIRKRRPHRCGRRLEIRWSVEALGFLGLRRGGLVRGAAIWRSAIRADFPRRSRR